MSEKDLQNKIRELRDLINSSICYKQGAWDRKEDGDWSKLWTAVDNHKRIFNLETGMGRDFMRKPIDYFIDKFLRLLWRGGFHDKHLFASYKLQIVEIEDARGKLDRLSADGFDETSLAKLEELALRAGKTIEEAVFNGSRAATRLVVVRMIRTEGERRNMKAKLEQQISEGQKALSEL